MSISVEWPSFLPYCLLIILLVFSSLKVSCFFCLKMNLVRKTSTHETIYLPATHTRLDKIAFHWWSRFHKVDCYAFHQYELKLFFRSCCLYLFLIGQFLRRLKRPNPVNISVLNSVESWLCQPSHCLAMDVSITAGRYWVQELWLGERPGSEVISAQDSIEMKKQ